MKLVVVNALWNNVLIALTRPYRSNKSVHSWALRNSVEYLELDIGDHGMGLDYFRAGCTVRVNQMSRFHRWKLVRNRDDLAVDLA